uniref:DacO3 n=1 Tax=Dactylosporangium sp. SC14051 TaxID=1239282 RepID=K4I699_9ACTN|nr:DacO3 [Dactylosporangium sp. SC14051]
MNTTDIAVVGCGPVGALLAGELRLAGVDAVVLERSPGPNVHSRAFRLQTATLELLDARGLLEDFLATAVRIPKTHFAGIRPPLLDLDRLDSEHPFTLGIPQSLTEAHLERWARGLGAQVRRGHEVLGVEQDGGGVRLDVEGPGGRYRLDAAYVVGCDGGRSTVRKLSGIGFPGREGTVSALLGDVTLDDPDAFPSGIPGTLRTATGLVMAVAMPGTGVRVFTCEFDRPVPPRDRPVTLDELRAAVRRVVGADVGMREPTWMARFTDASRIVAAYRQGRVFLAGDAAHVHFPIGAQGLNLGLQDAVNLGWKLAGRVRGWAPDTLLDTYDPERRPVAERVVRETRAQVALMNPDERIDPLRELFRELLAIGDVNLHLSRLLTGLDARYPTDVDAGAHPLVGRRAPALRLAGGVRVAQLLRRGRPVLLNLEPAAFTLPAAVLPHVDVVTGREEGAGTAAALLIRPDGAVAWVAGPDEDPQEAGKRLRGTLATYFAGAG